MAPKAKKKSRQAKHTAEAIEGKNLVVAAFVEAVQAKKGIAPKLTHAGDHAAAFALAKNYGAEEASAIVRRACEDPFVLGSNCNLRYIASKADSFRGSVPTKASGKHLVQSAPPSGSIWQVGNGS